MTKDYRAVIFDMDGTILNTIKDLTIATNHALSMYGLPEITEEEEKNCVGNGLYMTAKRAAPEGCEDKLVKKVYEELASYYKDHCEENTGPYEGIVEVIKELKDRGILTAVVSNKADYAVQRLVEKYFDDCFLLALGETEGLALKPAPDMVLEILKRLHVETKDAVYVGDANIDLKTAENAGMDCVAVSWGFRGRDRLTEYGAKTIIDRPKELLDIL